MKNGCCVNICQVITIPHHTKAFSTMLGNWPMGEVDLFMFFDSNLLEKLNISKKNSDS